MHANEPCTLTTDRNAVETTEVHTVPAQLQELPSARAALGLWLGSHHCDWNCRSDGIQLVLAELLTNAIEASSGQGTVTYSFGDNGDEIVLRFVNQNPTNSAVEFRSMPHPGATSGRGLALAQDYADRLDIRSIGEHVDISAHFYENGRGAQPPVP